jgi:hypothetical protein
VAEPVPEPEDPSLGVAGHLDLVELPALVARADEVLEAILRPLDGPSEAHRRVRDQDLLGIEEHDLRAEPAARVGGDDLDLELREPEDAREAVLDRQRGLGGVPHGELARAGIVLGHDAAPLQGAPAAALDVEPLRQHVGRPGERGVRVAHLLDDARGAVPRYIRVDERPRRHLGRLEVGHRRDWVVADVDQSHGVLGDVAVLGHHEGDELANVADHVGGERPLRPRVAQAGVRDQEGRGLVEVAEVGGGEDQVHARQRAGPRRVDRADARMRVRGAETGGVEHAPRLGVVDERAKPAEEPRILVTRDAGTDEAGRHPVGPLPGVPRRDPVRAILAQPGTAGVVQRRRTAKAPPPARTSVTVAARTSSGNS